MTLATFKHATYIATILIRISGGSNHVFRVARKRGHHKKKRIIQTPLLNPGYPSSDPLAVTGGARPLPYTPPVVNIFIRPPLSQNPGSAPVYTTTSDSVAWLCRRRIVFRKQEEKLVIKKSFIQIYCTTADRSSFSNSDFVLNNWIA